ncbi:hypothetical protein SGLAM104S_01081 [Streptomyces glaucescens]
MGVQPPHARLQIRLLVEHRHRDVEHGLGVVCGDGGAARVLEQGRVGFSHDVSLFVPWRRAGWDRAGHAGCQKGESGEAGLGDP